MKFYNKFQMEFDNELNELEKSLKKLFLEHPEQRFDLPRPPESSRKYLLQISKSAEESFPSILFDENLAENTFIQNNLDVGLYRHLRYLPANWHSHTFLEVVCVMQGTCDNYISEQKLQMTEGDVCILAPDTLHTICAFSDDCLIFNLLLRSSSFEHAFFGILAENDILSDFFMRALYHSASHPYLYFHMPKDDELFNYVGYAYDEFYKNRQYKNRMLNSIITAFFITLLRNHGAHVYIPNTDNPDRNKNTIFILKYMQEHFLTASLTELAGFFNYSERQIQRLIKISTGMSFSNNIRKLKMRRAARLLSGTDLSITAISGELGYQDPVNFRRAFKDYYGATPSEYRKNQVFPDRTWKPK